MKLKYFFETEDILCAEQLHRIPRDSLTDLQELDDKDRPSRHILARSLLSRERESLSEKDAD